MNQDRPSLAMCFLAYPAVAIVYIGLIAAALCLTGCGKDDTSATEQPQTPAEPAPVVEEPDEPDEPSPDELKRQELTARHSELTEVIAALQAERDAIDSPFHDETPQQRAAARQRLAKLEEKITPLKTEHAENVAKSKELDKKHYNTRKTETGRTVRTFNSNVRRQMLRLRKRRLAIESELRPIQEEFDKLAAEEASRVEYLDAVAELDQQISDLQDELNTVEQELTSVSR